MDFDTRVKLAVYRHFAHSGKRPSPRVVAARLDVTEDEIREAWARLRAKRVLLLEEDGDAIRMAPPFSGVETQHVVTADDVRYHANCAWDALGIPAALGKPARISSRCEQSGESLELEVGLDGPSAGDWLFHCHVPAARWWDDLVFT